VLDGGSVNLAVNRPPSTHVAGTGPPPVGCLLSAVTWAQEVLVLASGMAPPTQSVRLVGAPPSARQIAT
jgi:hypothetical protein